VIGIEDICHAGDAVPEVDRKTGRLGEKTEVGRVARGENVE
jgi:hypothetical protein